VSEFRGFPGGQLDFTPLPNLFFSELLPQIDDLAELKVTLHVLWLVSRKRDAQAYVTLAELKGDQLLLRSLRAAGPSGVEALEAGLERAVARGTLLRLAQAEPNSEHLYFVNSSRGRQAVDKALMGELPLPAGGAAVQPATPVERPNIFVLYEQNIGLLQPMIAEELRDAETEYPQEWIEEAFRIAAEHNVRNWKYVRRVLERRAQDGKNEGTKREKTWYTEEEYEKYVKH